MADNTFNVAKRSSAPTVSVAQKYLQSTRVIISVWIGASVLMNLSVLLFTPVPRLVLCFSYAQRSAKKLAHRKLAGKPIKKSDDGSDASSSEESSEDEEEKEKERERQRELQEQKKRERKEKAKQRKEEKEKEGKRQREEEDMKLAMLLFEEEKKGGRSLRRSSYTPRSK